MALASQIKNDGAGGWLILGVDNGSLKHRMKVHVPSFAAAPGPATGGIAPYDRAYNNVVGAQEPTVVATFYELAILLRDFYSSTWSIRLDALYLAMTGTSVTYGTPGAQNRTFAPQYPVPPVIPIKGQSGSSNNYLPGEVTWYMPTHGSGRFFLHILSSELWAPDGGKKRVDPFTVGQSGTPPQVATAYLQGQQSGRSATGNPGLGNPTFGAGYTTGSHVTMISGHDGHIVGSPNYATYTMNKRTRRTLRYT